MNDNERLTRWFEDHTLIDENNRGLIIGHWAKMPKDIQKTDIMDPKMRLSKIENKLDLNTELGMVKLHVNKRYIVKMKQKAAGNLPGIFLTLRQYFQEEPCKAIFPDAWAMFSEMEQRKAAAAKLGRVNRAKKAKLADHLEIRSLTRGMSARQAGRESGRF